MALPRRTFTCLIGERRYRKLFILSVEGIKIEHLYYARFNNKNSVVRLKCLKGKHVSSPSHVLARMEKYLKDEGLKASDEAWLVVDKDQWTDKQAFTAL